MLRKFKIDEKSSMISASRINAGISASKSGGEDCAALIILGLACASFVALRCVAGPCRCESLCPSYIYCPTGRPTIL